MIILVTRPLFFTEVLLEIIGAFYIFTGIKWWFSLPILRATPNDFQKISLSSPLICLIDELNRKTMKNGKLECDRAVVQQTRTNSLVAYVILCRQIVYYF